MAILTEEVPSVVRVPVPDSVALEPVTSKVPVMVRSPVPPRAPPVRVTEGVETALEVLRLRVPPLICSGARVPVTDVPRLRVPLEALISEPVLASASNPLAWTVAPLTLRPPLPLTCEVSSSVRVPLEKFSRAPEATVYVPESVPGALTLSVPALTWTVPALVKLERSKVLAVPVLKTWVPRLETLAVPVKRVSGLVLVVVMFSVALVSLMRVLVSLNVAPKAR